MFLSLRFPTFRGRETLGMSDAGMGSWLGAFVFGGSMFGVVLFGCLIFVGVGVFLMRGDCFHSLSHTLLSNENELLTHTLRSKVRYFHVTSYALQ